MKKKTTFSERRRGFAPFCLSLCFFMAVGGAISPLGAVEKDRGNEEQRTTQTVKQVLNYVEENSDYVIMYSKGLLQALDKQVSIQLDGEQMEQILKELASAAGLDCKINGRQVIVAPKDVAVRSPRQADQVKVSGIVIDEKGESVPGANISVKGEAGKGTVSDMDGNFSLNVSRGSVLVISFVGYVATEYKVEGTVNNLRLQLHPDTELLDEVVVVGYGMQRQSSITGAISSVRADELKGITSPSVSNMLQGKVAGVVATSTSGQPGAGVSIRIRGTGSIQGNQEALWVIDGVVGSSSAELNPNDIESISILKDGSATALYGSRGANGVIQVTTKRAKMGTSQVSLSAKFGVSTLQRGKLRMMNGAEYYDYLYEAFTNAGTLQNQVWLQPYLREANFDWWDYATQNALTQNYNISYQFGNDKIRSYIAGDYYTEDGTIKGFDYQRFTLRSNTDYIVNKRLTLKANLAASYRETFNQQHSLAYTSYTPWDTPYDSQGNLKDGSQGMPDASVAETADPRDYWYSDGGTNYAYDRHLNWSKSRQNAMDLGLGLEYKFFDWLIFRSNNRFGFTNNYSSSYTDPTSRGGAGTGGSFYDANSNTRSIYASQVLNMLKTFGDKHEINAYLGYEYDEYRYWDLSATAYKIFQGAEIINAGADDPAASGTKTEQKNMAVFFNGNYTFDSKYLFQLMVRHDGSSRFGANKRWATFWSVGAGWNMHEEEWIKELGWINQLKPRISYGISGNQPNGAYEWATVYSITQQYANEIAFYSNYAGNPNLSWEQTGSLDIGLDVRLFDRVNIVLDGYVKKVKNLIYLRHMPAVSGFNRQTANDGKMENKGFELTVTPEIIKTKDWYWDISFNMGYNHNEITYLPTGDDLTMQAVAVGYPYMNWYMREWAGVNALDGTPLWFKVDPETGQKTVTGNYNDATPVLLDASPTPKVNGGITTNLSWKGLSLNANFTFSAGAKIYNSMRAGALDRDGERPSQPAMALADGWSRWEKPGDIATHPQLMAGGNNMASSTSTRYLESGDYFKMKSITLSYTFPKKWLKPLKVENAVLSLNAENLFTITKYSGQDPEILLSTSYNGNASNYGYPTVRRFTVGLSVNF